MRIKISVVWAVALGAACAVACKKKPAGEGEREDLAVAPTGQVTLPTGEPRETAEKESPAAPPAAEVPRTLPYSPGQRAEEPPPAPPVAEMPRMLPCPPGQRTEEPTVPDPEAGNFTLEEALAGLPGTGQPVATIETSLGTITCRLAGDRVPVAVANFVGLARGVRPWWDPCRAAWVREPYYDGLTWHRVIPGFMAQGGDILGDGTGGPGYTFANEHHPTLLHDRPGTLAYANAGRDTNGSQFYITVGPRPHLDGGYVVFGYCDNVEVIERIVSVPRGPRDRPLQPVLIRKVTITREG